MEPDNFDLHIYSDGTVHYYHKNLKRLIDSVTEGDKIELEKFSDEISGKLGRKIKLHWGGKYYGETIENVLAHIDNNRQDLDLSEPEGIEKGRLRYQGHNLTNDYVRAPLFSILLRYISILNKHAIKKL